MREEMMGMQLAADREGDDRSRRASIMKKTVESDGHTEILEARIALQIQVI